MRIARVFPHRTEATPTDELAFIGDPPEYYMPECDEVHVSCAFTYDLPEAERLAKAWRIAGVPVKVGGPAYGKPSGLFEVGKYVKPGVVFSSRGCPNRCWHCSVWRREPKPIELPIVDGFNVQDDNLFAMSESHVRAVFDMLSRQKERAIFSGGLEAKILKPWQVDLMVSCRLDYFFCAYDTADDLEPLIQAGKMFAEAGIQNKAYAYVLIGYKGDTIEKAEKRLNDTWRAGFFPRAMLYLNDEGKNRDMLDRTGFWEPFQRMYFRPAITRSVLSGKDDFTKQVEKGQISMLPEGGPK